MKKSLTMLLACTLLLTSFSVRAQDAAGQTQGEGKAVQSVDTKQALQIIVLSGLGGAVLGLSTLSFYGNPQSHLRNISIGAAVAVVGATMYVTYLAAQGQSPSIDIDEGGEGPKPVRAPEQPDVFETPTMVAQRSVGAPQAAISFFQLNWNF